MAVNNPQAYTCTPDSLLASTPCLDCYSTQELLAGLVGILALNAEKTIPQLVEDSKCMKCMEKKQMLQAYVTIVGDQVLGEVNTLQDVLDQYHCLSCYSEKELQAMLLSLVCPLTITIQRQ